MTEASDCGPEVGVIVAEGLSVFSVDSFRAAVFCVSFSESAVTGLIVTGGGKGGAVWQAVVVTVNSRPRIPIRQQEVALCMVLSPLRKHSAGGPLVSIGCSGCPD